MNYSVIGRCTFKRSARCRSAGDDAPACRACGIYYVCAFLRNGEKLAVHNVIFYALGFNGSECTKPDVQHYRYDFYAHTTNFAEKLVSEMKSRRRCRCRTLLFGINRLIIVVIFQFLRYIRRKRHFAYLIEYGKQRFTARAVIVERHNAVSVLYYLIYRCGKKSISERNLCTFSQPSSGTDKHLPSIERLLAKQQKLASRAAFTAFFSVNASRNNL